MPPDHASATTITYLFDPLCGWCYAAAPQVAGLRAALGKDAVRGVATGLFWSDGKRPMTAEFRDYAWSNDQRIAQLTGQRFSQAYYDKVLSDFSVPFDSEPPTRAIAVAEMQRPGSGLDLLARMQSARFVEGRNLFAEDALFQLVRELGFDMPAFTTAFRGSAGRAAADRMAGEGQAMMRQLNLRGVPALALRHGDHDHAITGEPLVDPGQGLVEALVRHLGADTQASH